MSKKSIALLSMFLVSASSVAMADWSGRIEVHGTESPGGKEGPMPGKIFAKGAKLRVEVKAHGQDAVIVADIKGGKASMLMPAQKIAMDLPASMSDKKLVSCPTGNIIGCLKSKGYKKTGGEKVDGHYCEIWEGDELYSNSKTHQKIWHPTDLKEVFMLKSVTRTEKGGEVLTLVKDIKIAALDDSLFKVPGDFHKMKLPDFSPGAKH
jgi:hypothetical protein